MTAEHTVSSYLIDRLYALGVRHIFGVPGDYVLGFYHELEDSKLRVINTCDEQGAGFAADAYARINGLGVVCVTYCVGGLKVANTTAQAFAEKSPVVVISGAPGMKERVKTPLLHHVVRDFDTQLKIFEHITVASAVIDNAETACGEIDRVLNAAIEHKRPVYIELPRDMISIPVTPAAKSEEAKKKGGADTLREALEEAIEIISKAKRPVVVAGVEIQRFGLQPLLQHLLENTGIPVASTLLSKSVVSEKYPRYLGVYEGAMCREEVQSYVESSDCLIFLGTFMTDVNLGVFTAHIEQGRLILATSDKLSIRHHSYEGIGLEDFVEGLLKANIKKHENLEIPHPPPHQQSSPVPGKQISVQYLFHSLNAFLDDNTVVLADPGDAMFGALDMQIQGETEFLSPAFYTSLGFAIPGGIGVQMARPEVRPLVLVGDGSFQMSGIELATIARFDLNPIIVVLNNRGYGTERPMLDGSFNDIPLWKYSRIPEVFDKGKGFDVSTEDQLEEALQQARKNTGSFCILDVHISSEDRSPALRRLTATLAKRVQGKA